MEPIWKPLPSGKRLQGESSARHVVLLGVTCEHHWSVFKLIHTKKRDHLEQQQLNDLVLMQYNVQLKHNQLTNTSVRDNVIKTGSTRLHWPIQTGLDKLLETSRKRGNTSFLVLENETDEIQLGKGTETFPNHIQAFSSRFNMILKYFLIFWNVSAATRELPDRKSDFLTWKKQINNPKGKLWNPNPKLSIKTCK